MIVDKKLNTPVYTRRKICRALSLFRVKSGALVAEGVHVREQDDALVCAEGREFVRELPIETTALIRCIGMDHGLFAYADGILYDLARGNLYACPELPVRILCFLAGNEKQFFALTLTALYRLESGTDGSAGAMTAIADGGVCGAVHNERLFVASGYRVRYSKPLFPCDWTLATQGAGYLDLPAEGGEIREILSFQDDLYLIRERGISRLYASGDTLGFRAESVPYSCGEIRNGSAVNGGKAIYFFTESGLFRFNGSSCVRMAHCGSEMIARDKAVTAAFAGGNYHAIVTVNGERCLFCFDSETRRGHFVRFPAEQIAGGKELLFSEGKNLYRLTERGVGIRDSELSIGQTAFGLSLHEKMLDGIMIEGSGRFRIEVRAGRGSARFARGRAGEPIRFPDPLRGIAFSMRLRSDSDDACVRSVTFEIREGRS